MASIYDDWLQKTIQAFTEHKWKINDSQEYQMLLWNKAAFGDFQEEHATGDTSKKTTA